MFRSRRWASGPRVFLILSQVCLIESARTANVLHCMAAQKRRLTLLLVISSCLAVAAKLPISHSAGGLVASSPGGIFNTGDGMVDLKYFPGGMLNVSDRLVQVPVAITGSRIERDWYICLGYSATLVVFCMGVRKSLPGLLR